MRLIDPAWRQTDQDVDYDEIYDEVDWNPTTCGCGAEKEAEEPYCDDCYVRLRDER